MRISDWSSDVCSSDLRHAGLLGDHWLAAAGFRPGGGKLRLHRGELVDSQAALHLCGEVGRGGLVFAGLHVVEQAGGDRTSVVWGKGVAVRLSLGGLRIIQKTKSTE